MSVCLLLLIYVQFELSYDKFHKNHENIYRTVIHAYRNGELHAKVAWTYRDMGEAMKNEIPEVEEFCRYHPNWGGAVVRFEDENGVQQEFLENNMAFADSTFLTMFSFPIRYGSVESLTQPNSIMLTPGMVEKYFGDEDLNPTGKILEIDGGWAAGQYTITGVVEIPSNSQIHPEFIMSFYNLLQSRQYQEDNGWGWSNFYTYISLNANASQDFLREKLNGVIELHLGEQLASRSQREEVYLEPLADIHLYSDIEEDDTDKNKASNVYLFTAIGLFILVIAWVNYINLSTSKVMKRSKEVGVKKSIGAYRSQLMAQFLIESFIMNTAALFFAVVITYALLPDLSSFVEKELNASFLLSYEFLGIAALITIVGSFLSGFYPAWVISSFKPSSALKSGSSQTRGRLLSKSLVIFQFVCSFFLIAGTFTISQQVEFMKNQQLGLSLDQVLIVTGPNNINGETFRENLNTFKNEVMTKASIMNVASSANIPGGGYNLGTTLRRAGADVSEAAGGNATWVDKDFIDTYQLELITGNDFSEVNPEAPAGVIINEAAIKTFGLGDPESALSHQLIAGSDTINIRGVMKDYNWDALQRTPSPVLLVYTRGSASYFSFKVSTENLQETIAFIEKNYKAIFPGNPFDYYFADEFYNRQYKSEIQFGKIFGMFALLAIIVACLGLVGLATYTGSLVQKEVGIRKVLGAGTFSIVFLFSGHFLRLMGIATLLGIPLIYYAVQSWLAEFAYHIPMDWKLFVIPALLLIIIILISISFQTAKTALLNPVRTLRSE